MDKPSKLGLASKTPRHRIISALRKLWLQSRERAATLKRDAYTCQKCGLKQSKAKGKEVKVCVHHKREPAWDDVVHYIMAELLVDPSGLVTYCKKCHDDFHGRGSVKETKTNSRDSKESSRERRKS